jgi:ribonuclease P protein component
VFSKQSGAEQRDIQMLISVPKRFFKHAVDRNRVKRQVREAYRTQQALLALPADTTLAIAFIWLDNKHHTSQEVTAKVRNLLQRITEKVNA